MILNTLSFVFCFLRRSDVSHLKSFLCRCLLMSSKVSSLWYDCVFRGCRQLLFREEWAVQCGSNCVSHRKVTERADRLEGRNCWWKFCTVACLEVNEHIRDNDIIIIIIITQDQAISTNYFKNKILKEEIESKCRLCKQHETIDHVTSGCPIVAKNEHLMRHDKVCTHLHYSICKALGIETTDKWYTHMPKPVYEEVDVTVLWNQAVHTDREVTANRSDIIKTK